MDCICIGVSQALIMALVLLYDTGQRTYSYRHIHSLPKSTWHSRCSPRCMLSATSKVAKIHMTFQLVAIAMALGNCLGLDWIVYQPFARMMIGCI